MSEIVINNKPKQQTKPKSQFQESLKSNDTEEKIDILFYRPLGLQVAKLCAKWHITPNAVTIISIFFGIAAGILFYPQNIWINIIGMISLMFANTLDSADGQLARLTDQKSRWGRILDGFAGDFWFASIHFAIMFRSMNEGWSPIICLWGVLAGVSHMFQSAMADYYRNVHLFFIKGDTGSELDNSKDLTAQYEKMSWKKEGFKKFVLGGYRNYTKLQENISPRLQNLLHLIHAKYNDGRMPNHVIHFFRQKNKPLMPLTNIVQFNTRVIFLFLWLFLDQAWIYFFFDMIVLNSILIYMCIRQGRVSEQTIAYIENEKH